MDSASVRYIFLDRDGVINRKMPEGAWVTEWAQFEWLPGVVEAIARLIRAGLTVFVVTNQRGIALGRYTTAQLETIHDNMQEHLAKHGARVDAIFYCPHGNDECICRKPGTGMYEQAFAMFPQANAHNSLMIGDSLSDMQAGKRMGMQTIFIEGNAEWQKPGASAAAALADAIAGSLREAVEAHLQLTR